MSRVEIRQLGPDEARARTVELAALLCEAVDAGMALGQLAPVDTEQAFAEMIDALEPGERMLFGAFAGDELVGTAQLERAVTTHDGTPACAFYEALGYERLGVMPNYSRRPDGALRALSTTGCSTDRG